MENSEVVQYNEVSKLKSVGGLVNGGFMVFSKEIFNYLEPFNECILEKNVFPKLIKDRKLSVYEHDGFWQCLDNDRELDYLNYLCANNLEYWLI